MQMNVRKTTSRRRLLALCRLLLILITLATVAYCSSCRADDGQDATDANLAQAFTFRAEWFEEGDLQLRGLPYSDKYIALSPGPDASNSYASYAIDFPEQGDYQLWAFYSACDSRPVTLEFDGNVLTDKALANTNGSWLTSESTWDYQLDLNDVPPGVHILTVRTKSPDIPHFSAFRIVPKFEMSNSWNLPRQLAKTKMATSTWRPSPWSGGWYEYIARDRYEHRESGETFSDHFARETAWATVPKSRLEVIASERPLGNDAAALTLADELTYSPDAFIDATLTDDPNAETRVYMKVVVKPTEDQSQAQPPAQERIVLTKERLAQVLQRASDAIIRYRQDCDDPDYLAATLEKCERLKFDANVAFDHFSAEPNEANAQQCASLYVDAARLYARVGWANPILDFQQLLFVQRNASDLGLPQNYQSNCVLNPNGFDDALKTLDLPFVYDMTDPEEVDRQIVEDDSVIPEIATLFKPDYPTFLGDIDLHFDAEKALVSSMDRERRWNVFELDLNAAKEGKGVDDAMKAIIPNFPDADSYDACYMPDESVIFTSTACYIGVPCVSGTTRVTNTFRLDAKDNSIRRLTFDQEHNWCPTLTEDGRVMYLRWEYTDIPHVPGRLLFQMNPDGTNQRAYYASNSLWPVSMMYARPIPGSNSKFCCIVTGHHGVSRMGELILFDAQKGRRETEGALERICGFPKEVQSRTDPKYHSTLWGDNIADESWPKYLHPFPLSEDYYLVAAQPDRDALWGVYLVDRFDNMYLLTELQNFACFEPTPWRETERPPVLRERVELDKDDATVYCADVYFGDGLKNVPRGAVKNLRLYSYSYLYPMMGGATSIIGVDGPWDVRQVIGTVPVNEDGSALFKVPANVPIAIQPLDENGQALQQMRSWFTAMPGEFLSCVGCHEDENSTSSAESMAFITDREPSEIRPWNGPMRGFSFERDVQPVLDHYCVACHDGQDHGWGVQPFDLTGGNIISDFVTALQMGDPRNRCGTFSTSYMNLQAFVRRPGIESDYFLLNPMEFAANTTELYQILANGHYGLQMDVDAWDRIITWIDMNTPYHGTWTEFAGSQYVEKWNNRRKELLELYANFDDQSEEARGVPYDPKVSGMLTEREWITIPVNLNATDWERQILKDVTEGKRAFPDAQELCKRLDQQHVRLDVLTAGKPEEVGWEIPNRYTWDRHAKKTEVWHMSEPYLVPFDPNKQNEKPKDAKITVNAEHDDVLGDVITVALTPDVKMLFKKAPGDVSENATCRKDFWIGAFEVTNRQFEVFDPEHDSRVESRQGLSHGFRGFFVNEPEFPVCRVSWEEANQFCKWLSQMTGRNFRLPTEREWEYACRAGAKTPFYFGDWGADFSSYANLADQTLIEFISDNYFRKRVPLPNVTYYDDWVPKDRRFCDNGFLSERPGHYKPNAWGLFDMHGNVAEWTSTEAKPQYGVEFMDERPVQYVARGGSWHDRPYRASADFKNFYYPWQRVFDVGFRVLCDDLDNVAK
ncbi:MAG: SUMF1/EgtB/PvdO family nonheme iron enzyme [Planctomycetia bacterium]|nr:SUMF1/EgtB/PvdO family nonheme iron enzyme [Planctomycetia bacterium]